MSIGKTEITWKISYMNNSMGKDTHIIHSIKESILLKFIMAIFLILIKHVLTVKNIIFITI